MQGRAIPGCRALVGIAVGLALAGSGCVGVLTDGPSESKGTDPLGRLPNGETCRGMSDVGASRARRLTRWEYENAIRDLFGVALNSTVDTDGEVGPFSSNDRSEITGPVAGQYLTMAEQVSERIELDPLTAGCGAAESECWHRWIARIASRAYRRPASDVEIAELVQLFDASNRHDVGARRVAEAILQSPLFLYHLEQGVGTGPVRRLTQHELAARLSFFLWRSLPDERLLSAADRGELSGPTALEREARRMLQDDRAEEVFSRFFFEWLAVDDTTGLTKDAVVYPSFDRGVLDRMTEETRRFLGWAFRTDPTLTAVLRSRDTFIDAELSDYYGVAAPAVPWDRVTMPTGSRVGLLTHGLVMATHGKVDNTAPIQRGVLLQTHVLCTSIAPPPPGTDASDPPREEGVSRRVAFDMHRVDGCASCHRLIDPVGFAFERFSGAGVYREQDAGGAIDASGELVGTDVDGPFSGADELVDRILESDQLRSCMTRQWFRFALGRRETDLDACSIRAALDRFAETDDDLRELLVGIVTSHAFQSVRKETAP